MGVLIFILAMIWGSLSAQFLMQTVTSLILASVYLTGIAFSKVSRTVNCAGTLAMLAQVIVFGALFLGGNWFAGHYVGYSSFNTMSVASALSFVATIIYVVPRVPDKVLLGRMRAWVPSLAKLQCTFRRMSALNLQGKLPDGNGRDAAVPGKGAIMSKTRAARRLRGMNPR